MSLRVLDLFSGIGAYALGLERAEMSVAAFCEIEEYPRRVLRRHWPDIPIYDDVRTLDAATLRRDGIAIDVVCGGWPCQDLSPAGTRAGLDGARSGLWVEVARILGDVRPRWAVLENSSNLLGINGGADFGRVLGDLAALGYDVEWHCLPAAAFDAPHIRDRLWIVAHRRGAFADADQSGRHGRAGTICEAQGRRQSAHSGPPSHPHGHAAFGAAIARRERHTWEPEPDVVRVVHGAPNRVERIRALGNLNPPIVPELIGRAIINAVDGGRGVSLNLP